MASLFVGEFIPVKETYLIDFFVFTVLFKYILKTISYGFIKTALHVIFTWEQKIVKLRF